MCGIGGIVDLGGGHGPPDRGDLMAMASTLRHRGPDEFGIFRDQRAGLAHARLSIIDISSGQQPLGNEDGTLWIAFNGEIFNYLELRAELEGLGRRFRTQSDTEVIVQAFETWGEDAFRRMNGQWALALWDTKRQRLVLARDPLGIRPLYFCEHGGRLFFASEVKAIFAADADIPREFDPIGLEQTFTFWSVVPPQGVFRGVKEVRPGHIRSYEDGGIREEAYWSSRYPNAAGGETLFQGNLDDAVAATSEALEAATSLRVLRSDVPVGSYLSGGLDSSLVAAMGRRVVEGEFHTFSIRFEEAEYDETEFQRRVVESIQSEHHEVVVKRSDIANVFPEVIRQTERPILRAAPAPLFLLSALVRDQGIKVVLTGEGADEVFGGYDLFREGKVRRFWAKFPGSEIRPRLLERLYPYLARSPVSQQAMARQFFGRGLDGAHDPGFAHQTRWQTTSALKRLMTESMRARMEGRDVGEEFVRTLPEEFASWSDLAQDQFIELRTLLSGYLLSSQGDRMLMGHSVEGRFPFLDRDVVTLADSLPPEFKLKVLDEKHVLKRAASGLVPQEIVSRKKQPYRVPDAVAFLGQDAPDYVEALLSETDIEQAGVFHPPMISRLRQKLGRLGPEGLYSNTDNMAFLGVLSTQLLHDQFIRHRPVAEFPIRLTTDVDRMRDPESLT